MPAGYGVSATADGALEFSWAEQQLAGARSYWVCTTGDDGRPHAMPVWALWIDDSVVFSTDPESRKARNLARRPDAVIHLDSGDDVVIVEGRVERVAGDALPERFVDNYESKYGYRMDVSNPDFAFYRLRPSRILAWRESEMPTSAVRFHPDTG